jgi:lipopolysaccharide/colanic/teichoic acid biosynthesis glycosyltransferase
VKGRSGVTVLEGLMSELAVGRREGRAQDGRPAQVKAAIDRAGAALGLLLLSPVLAAIALAIRFLMGPPVFFRQVRPGKGGRPFEIVKFRTMLDARDERGQLRPDEERLTALGRFLRSVSLDELPQLWNVLEGELSLVGPRPLVTQYLDRYSARQARRHEVMPGITGWSQINGRNALSWEEKLELDVWYVEHWSLGLDLKILALTLGAVLGRKGVSNPGHATMPDFLGSAGPRRPA